MRERPPASVYGEDQIRRLLPISEAAFEAVERAFTWLAEGRAELPPVMHIEVGEGRGDVDVKSAFVAGEDGFAVKIAAGFFGNPNRGLPSGSGLMVVLNSRTGFCDAVLLDNGYLTDLRTGLAGAVAAKYLAPQELETVGVVGSGVQARLQIEALRRVRRFKRLLVSARNTRHLQSYCDDMIQRLGPRVRVEIADGLPQLMGESQCVVTTTPSRTPLLRSEWLHPGLHITAVGADLPGKQELEAEILRRADLLVCDSMSQAGRLGELQHLHAEDADRAVELGEITCGRHPGRTDPRAVTVCDLTGVGTQDTAIALFALSQLRKNQEHPCPS